MNLPIILQTVGLVVLASFACWKTEEFEPLHPFVRRGLQLAEIGLVGAYLARLWGF
jgi:hypothetical protein